MIYSLTHSFSFTSLTNPSLSVGPSALAILAPLLSIKHNRCTSGNLRAFALAPSAECSSSKSLSRTSFKSLLKPHFLSEVFPEHSIQHCSQPSISPLHISNSFYHTLLSISIELPISSGRRTQQPVYLAFLITDACSSFE